LFDYIGSITSSADVRETVVCIEVTHFLELDFATRVDDGLAEPFRMTVRWSKRCLQMKQPIVGVVSLVIEARPDLPPKST
jgi:hypothetical protein